MRTGSIGNRDAETLVNTLVEPKRTILGTLRKKLLSLGYSEETGYDAINIESYISYSIHDTNRFLLKHKWELLVTIVFLNPDEKSVFLGRFPELGSKEIETNTDDGTLWCKLYPTNESELIVRLAEFFASH